MDRRKRGLGPVVGMTTGGGLPSELQVFLHMLFGVVNCVGAAS